jgi:outer membrane protein OmpA-like peptidoglycan-associated protein
VYRHHLSSQRVFLNVKDMILNQTIRPQALRAAIVTSLLLVGVSACSVPTPGPDKTAAGTVLGAAWGAGAGAVIGNQVNSTGGGIAVGAGFGAVAGMMAGAQQDIQEGTQLEQERKLAALKVHTFANQMELEKIQARLDTPQGAPKVNPVYQVFFDEDATSMRSGALSNLEAIAESIKTNPYVGTISIVGHSDDTGNNDYNEKLALARASSVAAYLAGRGIALDKIKTSGVGSQKPIANNATPAGRQLNRRVDVQIGR